MKYVLKWDLGRWLPSLGVVDFPRKVFLVQLYYINEWRQLVGKQVWSLHLQSTSKCYQGPQQNLMFSETLVNSHLLYFCKTIKVKDSAAPSPDNLLMSWSEGIFWARGTLYTLPPFTVINYTLELNSCFKKISWYFRQLCWPFVVSPEPPADSEFLSLLRISEFFRFI